MLVTHIPGCCTFTNLCNVGYAHSHPRYTDLPRFALEVTKALLSNFFSKSNLYRQKKEAIKVLENELKYRRKNVHPVFSVLNRHQDVEAKNLEALGFRRVSDPKSVLNCFITELGPLYGRLLKEVQKLEAPEPKAAPITEDPRTCALRVGDIVRRGSHEYTVLLTPPIGAAGHFLVSVRTARWIHRQYPRNTLRLVRRNAV